MARAHDLHEAVKKDHPAEAPYVVPFAYRVRWYVTMNLREAVHFCELRSMPQGHPDYRLVVQEIWRRIEEVHPGLAAWGGFVNRDTYRLGRLQSEMRTEWKRARQRLRSQPPRSARPAPRGPTPRPRRRARDRRGAPRGSRGRSP